MDGQQDINQASDHVGGEGFHRLYKAARLLQDTLATASGMPDDVMDELTATLTSATTTLDKYYGQDEGARWVGRRWDLPARGSLLIPPYVVEAETPTSVTGRVTFTAMYLGGGAAHGGSQPLLFDDLCGRASQRSDGTQARTAYLKVNYRKITPLDTELYFDVRVDRIEGRKTFTIGQLTTADGTVLCDAEGLFVQLRPGQP